MTIFQQPWFLFGFHLVTTYRFVLYPFYCFFPVRISWSTLHWSFRFRGLLNRLQTHYQIQVSSFSKTSAHVMAPWMRFLTIFLLVRFILFSKKVHFVFLVKSGKLNWYFIISRRFNPCRCCYTLFGFFAYGITYFS